MAGTTDRRFEVQVNNETIIGEMGGKQFRIIFNITVDFGGFTSYAEIKIYSLKETTVNKAFKKGSTFGLRAGYLNNIGFIFKGEIINVFREREGADTFTTIIARSDARTKKNMNESLGKNVKVYSLVNACANSMGYTLVADKAALNALQDYPNGFTLNGDARVHLDDLARAHEFEYVVENGSLIVVLKKDFRKGSIVQISRDKGMEGIPIITETGVDVNTRLNQKLKIGGRFEVKSDFKSFNFSGIYFKDVPETAGVGVYKVQKLEYTGDSHGDDWTTGVTGLKIT